MDFSKKNYEGEENSLRFFDTIHKRILELTRPPHSAKTLNQSDLKS